MRKSRNYSPRNFLLLGLGAGLAAAYFLDPRSGRARRVRVRDRSLRFSRSAVLYAERRMRDLSHRVRGRIYELKRQMQADVEVDDQTLLSRVRSEMGHAVSHSRALKVDVQHGNVVLSGPILSDELEALLHCVEKVPGVKSVLDRMDVHDSGSPANGLRGRLRNSQFKGGTHGTRH